MKQLTKRKVYACLVLFILLICASSCTSKSPAIDTRFLDCFSLSDEVAANLNEELQVVEGESDYDDCVLRVVQTVGNEQILYVAVDVKLTGEVNLQSLLPAGYKGDGSLNMPFENVLLIDNDVDFGEFDNSSLSNLEMSLVKSDRHYKTPFKHGVSSVDLENNTVSYVFGFNLGDDTINADHLTFLIYGSDIFDSNLKTELSSKVHSVTWAPTNKGTVLKANVLNDSDEVIGNISLSRFSLCVELNSKDYNALYADQNVLDLLQITMKDGSALEIKGIGDDESKSSGYTKIQRYFNDLIPIEDVSSIKLDDLKIEMN